ncbi:hypothetical protein QTN25_008227 [Entamoeba marina]
MSKTQPQLNSPKCVDSYSMLIVSKYFQFKQDYINLLCVCKKFKETTEKLRFNPISITSLKLFPKIQTQFLYDKNDKLLNCVQRYNYRFTIDYTNYLKYNQNNTTFRYVTYTINNRKQYGKSIPDIVSVVDAKCFEKSSIKDIIIPCSVTSIGNECFYMCKQLESVVISHGLTRISNFCFSECSSLTSVVIPSSVLSIGASCFNYCKSIQTITIPNSVTSIENGCFLCCRSLMSITLPFNLSLLEDNTFCSCLSLTKVILPSTLSLMGNKCFLQCKNLTSITLPTTLKSIGDKCFYSGGLHSIIIPKSVSLLGVDCFSKCTKLSDIQFQSNHKEFNFNVSNTDSILYKQFGIICTSIILTKNDVGNPRNGLTRNFAKNQFIIQNNFITEFDNNVFSCERDLNSIIIPTSVTALNDNCFDHCESLTSLSIPSTVKRIGMNCFRGCEKLSQLSLPLNENNTYPFKLSYHDYKTLKRCNIDCDKIEFSDLFYHQSIPTNIPVTLNILFGTFTTSIQSNIISLKQNHLSKDISSIVIPTTVTYLCDECFKNYLKLQSITIPTSIKYVGKHLIDGCTSLNEVNYEGNWDNIIVSYNDHLEFNRKGLSFNSIEYTNDDKIKYGNVIPSIVHSLHHSYYNRSVEMIHIPTHITSLDNHMFKTKTNKYGFCVDCSRLQSVTIPTSIKTIPKHCFSLCRVLTNVSLPSTLTSIKKKSFSNCISLESIIIPLSVTLIEEQAFEKCYSLTSITLPTTLSTFKCGCFKECNQLKSIIKIPEHCF